MVLIQWFDGQKWIDCETWQNAEIAWATLGGDNYNYRVIDAEGKVLKINQEPFIQQ